MTRDRVAFLFLNLGHFFDHLLVLVFATLMPLIYFGLVTAFVISMALVADLVVLPAALLLFRPKL